jgi:hypothetical protein
MNGADELIYTMTIGRFKADGDGDDDKHFSDHNHDEMSPDGSDVVCVQKFKRN